MGGTRAVACVLLALFVHAFVVSATHCHRFELSGGTNAPAGVSVSERDEAGHLAETDAHAQCLLCRLQRGFTFDLDSSPLLVGPTTRPTLAVEHPAVLSHASQPFGVPSGRAPPT